MSHVFKDIAFKDIEKLEFYHFHLMFFIRGDKLNLILKKLKDAT